MNGDNMKETNAHINNQSIDLTDLLKGIANGNYPHLKILMSRKNDDQRLPQNFLYIDPSSFGKVRVVDLWSCDDKICIEVQESTTGTIKELSVDVNAIPDFQMVRWDDIVKMVQNERTSSTSSDQLLEFDY